MSETRLNNWPLLKQGNQTGCLFGFFGILALLPAGCSLLYVVVASPYASSVPGKIMAGLGLLMVAIGLFSIRSLIRYLRESARLHRLATDKAVTPWEWDYPWNRGIVFDRTFKTGRGAMIGAVLLGLYLLPFHWAPARTGDAAVLMMLLGFDAIVAVLAARAVYQILERRKYGRISLRYSRFPLLVGDEVNAVMSAGAWLRDVQNVVATMRCVIERTRTEGSGKHRKHYTEAFGFYEDRVHYDAAALRDTGLEKLPIRFVVPAGLPGTKFGMPATYWDIEVEATMPGVDYRGHFLAPVYAAQASSDESADGLVSGRPST